MDNISEKLGLYDFFNVISVGAIFLLHIAFLFPQVLPAYSVWISNNVIEFTLLFVLSYLLGLFFQELGAFLDEFKFLKKRITGNFLTKESIIANDIKLGLYRKYAKDILAENEIEFSGVFTQTQNEYIYGYIEYYIEYHNRNKKFEKMRALYGMSKSLLCCMGVVGIVYVIGLCFPMNINKFCTSHSALPFLYVFTSMVVFYFRAKRCLKYRIHMMMGVYSSIIDSERKIKNEE